MLKRSRRWFIAGGLVILTAGIAAAVGLPALPATRRRMIQRIIYYYAPGILFEGGDLEQFAAYVEREILSPRKLSLRRLDLYAWLFIPYHSVLARRLPRAPNTILVLDQEIMDKFLTATDFFEGPATPGRRISLVRPLDPYEAGCANPVAITS